MKCIDIGSQTHNGRFLNNIQYISFWYAQHRGVLLVRGTQWSVKQHANNPA